VETLEKDRSKLARRDDSLPDQARSRKSKRSSVNKPSPYVSPGELAGRWRCSRSTVDRIAQRGGLHRLLLGEGRNGMVRFILEEAEELERKSTI